MFFLIIRLLIISYLTYLVSQEAGIDTALVVGLIMLHSEFVKWSINGNMLFFKGELKQLQLEAADDRLLTRTNGDWCSKTHIVLTDRIEHLELIIGPIKGSKQNDKH